ncbi:MAG: NAD(P)-dependent oxidoreductase [Rectinemataceae bacterium]|nr:NAD(P)-dependent oxidoreductase [Rectinemataceae bacterium]
MHQDKKNIGFIGVGVMGSSMAGHILAAGHAVAVYTRTAAKAKGLLDKGATWMDSPAALARSCNVIITMVGYPADVESVYFGETGLIANAQPGTILIDMTTSSPDLARRIHEAAAANQIAALDAPVSGGDTGARNATLTIMVGGDEASFLAAKPLLDLMGTTVIRQGGPGAGQHTKLANQIAVAANLLGVVEAISYATAAGLDPRKVLLSIGSGSAGSWQLATTAPRILDGNFNPGFYLKHFLKDLKIALEASRQMRIQLPLLGLAEKLFDKASTEGLGELGSQAVFKLYENGLV